jgi:hypothetical protein
MHITDREAFVAGDIIIFADADLAPVAAAGVEEPASEIFQVAGVDRAVGRVEEMDVKVAMHIS